MYSHSRLTTLNAVRTQLPRSEEHTSELQSQSNFVCRLLLEKKKSSLCPPPFNSINSRMRCLSAGSGLFRLSMIQSSGLKNEAQPPALIRQHSQERVSSAMF